MRPYQIILLVLLSVFLIGCRTQERPNAEKYPYPEVPLLLELPDLSNFGLRIVSNYSIDSLADWNEYAPKNLTSGGAVAMRIEVEQLPGAIINAKEGYYGGGYIEIVRFEDSKNMDLFEKKLLSNKNIFESVSGFEQEQYVGDFHCYAWTGGSSAMSSSDLLCFRKKVLFARDNFLIIIHFRAYNVELLDESVKMLETELIPALHPIGEGKPCQIHSDCKYLYTGATQMPVLYGFCLNNTCVVSCGRDKYWEDCA